MKTPKTIQHSVESFVFRSEKKPKSIESDGWEKTVEKIFNDFPGLKKLKTYFAVPQKKQYLP